MKRELSEAAWVSPNWATNVLNGVHALTTTRSGVGSSASPFDRFNMGNFTAENGDSPSAVQHNRQLLTQLAKLPSDPFWLKQVHGTEVVSVDASTDLLATPTADAAVTRIKGQVLAILTADCLPVLMCDQNGTVVGAAHAGWRSLLGGVIENTIEAMDVDPRTLHVWLGPAAGPTRYEVGLEVYDAFVSRDWRAGHAFRSTRDHHWNMDMYALAKMRLEDVGVDPISQVSGGDLCTISDKEQFFSHRRDQRTGRMASLIWMD